MKIGRSYSDPHDVGEISVPQGSKLAPLLYLFYVNDMPNSIVGNAKIFQFADDTAIAVAEDTIEQSEKLLQQNYDMICKWSHDNHLTINAEKTKMMCINGKKTEFTTKIKHHEHSCLHKNINETYISNCDCEEFLKKTDECVYLGLTIDHKFNFKPHIQKTRKKLKTISYHLYNLQYYTTKTTLKTIYHNLIESNILYGLQIWGNSSPANLVPIKQILEGILKILTPKRQRNGNILEVLDVLALEELFLYHFVINNYFKEKQLSITNNSITLRPRQFLPLEIPNYNNKHGQRTQEYLKQKIFKTIPKQYLQETNYRAAKIKIKEWIWLNRKNPTHQAI